MQQAQKSGLLFSTSGSLCNLANPMLLHDLNGKNLQQMLGGTSMTFHGIMAEKQSTGAQGVPRKQQYNKPEEKNTEECGRKRKQPSNAMAVENPSGGKASEVENSMVEGTCRNDNVNDINTPFSILPSNPSPCDHSEPKGFSFKEVGSLHSANNNLLCCHFSSQGKLLAGAGHEKKVLIWNTDNFTINSMQGHSDIITDIRFKPNSTVFATSSFDKSVLVWDASKPRKSPSKLLGHTGHVVSLDFHPRKADLLCSCDSNNEIRTWDLSKSICISITPGAGRQVRFQPRVGELLATVTGNFINLIDVETKGTRFQLKGHTKDVRTVCWDSSGMYIASISEDSARIWSLNASGRCIYELQSNGNQFESCIFHPGYSLLLVIGTYKSILLWNPTDCNRTWSYPAHDNIIAAMAESPHTETMATASHDQWLKLWK